jgi:hypothetical protein
MVTAPRASVVVPRRLTAWATRCIGSGGYDMSGSRGVHRGLTVRSGRRQGSEGALVAVLVGGNGAPVAAGSCRSRK